MSMITKKAPVGISDFKEMVTGDYCYVDKTLFIKEVIEKGDKILLIPRPRRFGKTLRFAGNFKCGEKVPGQNGKIPGYFYFFQGYQRDGMGNLPG